MQFSSQQLVSILARQDCVATLRLELLSLNVLKTGFRRLACC